MVRSIRKILFVTGPRCAAAAASIALTAGSLLSCAGPPAAPVAKPVAAAAAPIPGVAAPPSVDVEADKFARQIEQTIAAAPRSTPPAPPDIQWVAPETPGAHAPAVAAMAAATPPAAPAATPALRPLLPAAPPSAISAEIELPAKPAAPGPPPAEMTTARLVEELAARLDQERRTGKAALRSSLAAAALSLIEPGRELTDKDLLSLSTDERQLVLAYQRVFTRLGQSMDGKDAAADREAMRLAAEELGEQLATQQRLRIRRAMLCTKVSGYGMFTRFPSSSFLAGREHPVIVYAELDHFRPQVQDDGLYTVRLTQEIVLYNEADGLAVWRVRPSDIIDRSHNRRRDFFVVQIVQLPNTLSVGKYILSLSVTDQHGQSMDEAKVPIQIVADETLIRNAAAGQ